MRLSAWERALIEESRAARLATIGPRGLPALVPVCYAFIEDRFVIPIDEKPKSGRPLARLQNIDRDPRVSLLMDRYDDDWTQLAWLRIEGTAAAIDGSAWPAAIVALRGRYPQYAGMALETRPLIVITPTRSRSWRWPSRR
jgi:PPOX class probable F420-dependent enzyme